MTIYDENGVPTLYRGPDQKVGLSEDGRDTVDKAKDRALRAAGKADADTGKHLLLGESVVIHCKQLAGTSETGAVTFSIGAENLDEALKSCIGAFDVHHLDPPGVSSDADHTPDWVASTHKGLAGALADYYSCQARDIAEVL